MSVQLVYAKFRNSRCSLRRDVATEVFCFFGSRKTPAPDLSPLTSDCFLGSTAGHSVSEISIQGRKLVPVSNSGNWKGFSILINIGLFNVWELGPDALVSSLSQGQWGPNLKACPWPYPLFYPIKFPEKTKPWQVTTKYHWLNRSNSHKSLGSSNLDDGRHFYM